MSKFGKNNFGQGSPNYFYDSSVPTISNPWGFGNGGQGNQQNSFQLPSITDSWKNSSMGNWNPELDTSFQVTPQHNSMLKDNTSFWGSTKQLDAPSLDINQNTQTSSGFLPTTAEATNLPDFTSLGSGKGFWGDMTGIGKVGFGLSALNTFGQLGLGYRAMRAQEDANAHTKNAFNLNFGMKKEQYDRSIRDRAVAHAGAAGLSGAARDAYIAEQAKKVGG